MHNFLKTALITFFILLSAAPAFADYKIATIDINKVVNSSSQAKGEKASLEAATDKAKKQIEEKRIALKPLQDKAKSGAITPNSKEGEQLKKQTQELVELMRSKEDELQRQFASSNKTLTEKAVKIVEKYAKDNNIQIVLDRNEAIRSAVLYGDSSFDITDKIIELNGK